MIEDRSLRLGKKPARRGAVRLNLRDYIDLTALPSPPAAFGHDDLVTVPFGMLGNDSVGNCLFAGGDHEQMLWAAEAGVVVPFTDVTAISDYSAVTGYIPGDPSTDNGGDMAVTAAYRKAVGLLDANGNRHKVGAYLAITPGDVQEHLIAAYIFGAVGVGIEFPQSAMDQFNAGQPWDLVVGSPIVGGHYIPLVARRGGLSVVVTWGQTQEMTDLFLTTYNDESVVYLSPELLTGGVTLEGFNLNQLLADLAVFGGPQQISVNQPMTGQIVFTDAVDRVIAPGPIGAIVSSDPSVVVGLSKDGQWVNVTATAMIPAATPVTLTWNGEGPLGPLSFTRKVTTR